MGSSLRVEILEWSDVVAEYALFMLMTYLTDVWKLNFRQSAAIINVFWGMAAIMPIAIKFIIRKFIDSNYGKPEAELNNLQAQKLEAQKLKEEKIDRWTILLSSISYTVGLGLLTFSAPEMVSGTVDSGNAYYKSIGGGQETLFYSALPLIAIARSGFTTSLEKLINGHKRGISVKLIDSSVSIAVRAVANIVGLAFSYVIKKWLTRFGIPALCMTLAMVIFSTVFCVQSVDKENRPTLLTKFYDVLKLLTEVFNECILRPMRSFFYYCCCCCCVKGCIKVLSGAERSEETNNNTATGRENENEETRFIISLFPICLLGLVSSLGNTFFLEQAYSMDRNIMGSLKVPLVTLLACYNLAKFVFPKLYFGIIDSWIPKVCRRFLNRVGMALSLLCALLCCVVAAKVESRRIHVVKSHGLVIHSQSRHDYYQPVPMTILYLVPQFFLLGGFFGMAYESVRRFFDDCKIPPRMEPSMVDSAIGVFGLGNIGSVLFVYLIHNITSRGDSHSWFTETINTSRLDKYYWVLSVWTAINLVWYVLVALPNPPDHKDSATKGRGFFSVPHWCPLAKYCFPENPKYCCCCCCCCCCCDDDSNDRNQETVAARSLNG